jgi:hypothetical protein
VPQKALGGFWGMRLEMLLRRCKEGWIVRKTVVPLSHQDQTLDLTLCCLMVSYKGGQWYTAYRGSSPRFDTWCLVMSYKGGFFFNGRRCFHRQQDVYGTSSISTSTKLVYYTWYLEGAHMDRMYWMVARNFKACLVDSQILLNECKKCLLWLERVYLKTLMCKICCATFKMFSNKQMQRFVVVRDQDKISPRWHKLWMIYLFLWCKLLSKPKLFPGQRAISSQLCFSILLPLLIYKESDCGE